MKRTVYTISAYCFLVLPFLTATPALAQGVGIGTATPDASAQVQVSSTTQGVLAPRLSAAQRSAMVHPANGLLVFQTDGIGAAVDDGHIAAGRRSVVTGG